MHHAALSSDMTLVRPYLIALLDTLEASPDWYVSVFLERRSNQAFVAKMKQTEVADSATMGVVLRIYDGFTLYEQATDDIQPDSLVRQATALVARVRAANISTQLKRRPYQAPTWAQRLSVKHDPQISQQIPVGVGAETQVHFGIAFEEDPVHIATASRLERLKDLLTRMKRLAPVAALQESDLTYMLARERVAAEESIFIDRETNLSQTIYRVSLLLYLMSGTDHVSKQIGGLGGAEALEISDDSIKELLRDLAALKNAERLTPGRFSVLCAPGISGVIAHEAFGHSQEADTCARGRSRAWDLHRSGTRVGNQYATILNNPAIFQNGNEKAAAWGSYFFDEEGWLACEQVLLDRGELKAPMTNLTSSIRLSIPRSANGKRESWQNGVYARQTNTYFSAGDKTLDELIAMLNDGFVATHAAGGMEDPKGMGIQVGIQFLKEVKDGKYTGRVFKGPAGGDIQFTGYVPEVLDSIVAKSKIEYEIADEDNAVHPHNDVGGCGKYHKELVNAGCGGPYMLFKDIVLG